MRLADYSLFRLRESIAMNKILAAILVAAIRFYRMLRPEWIHLCRFEPTCSRYAWQAVTLYGPWHGSLLTVRRLLRCQPFNPGGLDPL